MDPAGIRHPRRDPTMKARQQKKARSVVDERRPTGFSIGSIAGRRSFLGV
jgi:hypothetical protein